MQPKHTRPRRHDRSPPEPFPVSFVPFDIRPEHPLAPTEPACSSNSRGRNSRNVSMTGTSPRASVPGLAVGSLAQRRSILRSDTNRMRAFLGYRSIVDHQHGIAAADHPIRLNKQFRLHRPRIPDPDRKKWCNIVFAKPKRHSAECSCDRQDRSAAIRRVDASVAATCDPTDPEMA
jgi:hypothetical protein